MSQGERVSTGTFSGIVAILIVIPILFYDTTWSMIQVWAINETYTHGFLILPISLWLIWRKKHEINQQTPKPELKLLLVLLSVLGIWLLAEIVGVRLVQQLAVVGLIPVMVWLLFGRSILLTIMFPLLYLFFAVPLGQSLIPIMMEFTANFTVNLINLTGIPVYQDGLSFSLPSGSWNVVEECSGVRYLIASLALGTIYAYTSYESNRKRSLFILASIIVPILANSFRAFGIVMAGHFSGMELAVGVDHLLYGWVFFGIVMFITFYIGSFWWDPITSDTPTQSPSNGLENTARQKKILTILTGIVISCILSINLLAYQLRQIDNTAASNIDLVLPDNFGDWQNSSNEKFNWKPEILNSDAASSRGYQSGNDLVQLDLGYFGFQREGAEAISTQNRLTNPYGGDWKIIHSSGIDNQAIYITETVIQRMGQKLLIWNWYKIGQHQTSNAYIAKILEAYNRIFLNRRDATVITLATTLGDDKGRSRSNIRDFWSTASTDTIDILESIANSK